MTRPCIWVPARKATLNQHPCVRENFTRQLSRMRLTCVRRPRLPPQHAKPALKLVRCRRNHSFRLPTNDETHELLILPRCKFAHPAKLCQAQLSGSKNGNDTEERCGISLTSGIDHQMSEP